MPVLTSEKNFPHIFGGRQNKSKFGQPKGLHQKVREYRDPLARLRMPWVCPAPHMPLTSHEARLYYQFLTHSS